MRFMEHPLLSRLSVLVNELNVGDRLLCGKLELFSTEKSSLVQKKSALSQQEVNLGSKRQRISLEYGVDSAEALSQNDTPRQRDLTSLGTETPKVGLPIGDFEKKESAVVTSKDSSMLREKTTEEGKELLVNLVTTLNACFPDYDFSSVTSEAFVRVTDFVTVYTSINYHLSFFAERVIPGFLNDLWCTIREVIDLRNSQIYSYTSAHGKIESDPYLDDHGCLFSFDYFFVDEKQHRILFFSCMTKRKEWPSTDGQDEDSEAGRQSAGTYSQTHNTSESDLGSSYQRTLSGNSLLHCYTSDGCDDDLDYTSRRGDDEQEDLLDGEISYG